ncbi:hypothetical protein MNBD_ALPHA09-258 [hydrothermal vent metagenome]|uniref:Uncharacterized protein n=1 Tax=hydrothermal vent metagenome TaxID=652676 RepID=A0A3B0TUN4_9ZZZZ
MMKMVLSKVRRSLVVLPAVAVLGLSLLLVQSARGQLAPGEPLVLIADDAEAFVAALQSEFPIPKGSLSADIVVIYPAPPTGAHLVLIDAGAKRKFWTTIALHRLRDVLARLGEPA